MIKHFKLIHLILTILAGFIAISSLEAVNFFREYVSNNFYASITDNMGMDYVSSFLILAIILALGIFLALVILLRAKKKPNTFYMVSIGYYLFLLVMLLVARGLINGLSDGLWETAAALQYRDFAQIIYYPQLGFIVILIIRTLGFDVKKFDFKNDLKDLELTDEDSELIEINIGFDISKVERTIRRVIREFRYYFKENKFIIVVIGFIGVAFIFYKVSNNYEKTKYNYKVNQSFNYNGFSYKIEDSIITNLDYAGNIIKENTYYLLVKLSVTNNSGESKPFEYDNFKIYEGRDYYKPELDIGTNFIDYAKPYRGENIRPGTTKTYLLTYVIGKKYKSSYNITLYAGVALKKENENKIIKVKINPIVLDEIKAVSKVKLNIPLSFKGTYLNDTTLNIKDYQIGENYQYKYQICSEYFDDDCREYTGLVTPNMNYSINNKLAVLALDCDFTLDETSAYSASYKEAGTFFENFVKVRYTYNGETQIEELKNLTPAELKGTVVLQLSGKILDATDVELLLTIRNKSYIVTLLDDKK